MPAKAVCARCRELRGRAFGRRKLAPSISPGKSWEGVWSGQAGVLLLAVVWVKVESGAGFDSASLFSSLYGRLGVVAGVVVLDRHTAVTRVGIGGGVMVLVL